MKEIIRNKKLIIITSVLLIIVIAAGGFWIYHNPVSVEASGVVSINVDPGPRYAPGDEIISERTENAKKYYLSQDSYALDVSMAAIHYKDNYADQQEEWKDIDLTFQDGRITKAPYILTVNQDDKSLTVQDKKTGQTTTLNLTKLGTTDINNFAKKGPTVSTGKIQWDNVATDLDLAISAENTRVSFDWIVKSENAPHEAEFEVNDGGIPITYRGADADGKAVEVAATRVGNRVTERIEKGGKYPKVINPIIDVNTGASVNDCRVYWDSSAWNFYSSYIYCFLGYYYSFMFKEGAGLRFSNITIPANSSVTSAYLSLNSAGSSSNSVVNSRITGNKENNPAAWSTIADYQARRGTVVGGANNSKITSAQVNWDNIGAWTGDQWYNSPNISAIIQELINAHAPNNEALALFCDDHDNKSSQSNNTCKIFKSYDASSLSTLIL